MSSKFSYLTDNFNEGHSDDSLHSRKLRVTEGAERLAVKQGTMADGAPRKPYILPDFTDARAHEVPMSKETCLTSLDNTAAVAHK